MGRKKHFSMFIFLIFKKYQCKCENNAIINVNLVALAQITFPDPLSFSILGERRRSLSC